MATLALVIAVQVPAAFGCEPPTDYVEPEPKGAVTLFDFIGYDGSTGAVIAAIIELTRGDGTFVSNSPEITSADNT